MKGMGSRARLRILRTLVVFAFAAAAVLAVAPAASAAPQSPTTSPSTIQPRYVECASIVWQNTAQSQSGGSYHVMLFVTLQKAVDAHDFTFCGLLRTYERFDQTAGYCNTFYAAVRYNGVKYGTNGVYSCADGGSLYSRTYSGACGMASGWDYVYGDEVDTIGDCY